jgi:hypothetical protein
VFEAVATDLNLYPTSEAVSRYVDAVAPAISDQVPVEPKLLCHLFEEIVGVGIPPKVIWEVSD